MIPQMYKGLQQNKHYSCQISIKLEFSGQIMK